MAVLAEAAPEDTQPTVTAVREATHREAMPRAAARVTSPARRYVIASQRVAQVTAAPVAWEAVELATVATAAAAVGTAVAARTQAAVGMEAVADMEAVAE